MVSLSTYNNIINNVKFGILTLLCLLLFIFNLKNSNSNYNIVFGVLFLVVCILFFLRVRKTPNIFYDKNYLYLINFKETKQLKLESIYSVNYLSSKIRVFGLTYYKYSIELNKSLIGTEYTILFWAYSDNRISKFKDSMLKHAPNIKFNC